MAPKITVERTNRASDILATTRDIRSDESSLCYCLEYVTTVSWRRVVAILGKSRRSVSRMHCSVQKVCDESWHQERRVVALALDYNTEISRCATSCGILRDDSSLLFLTVMLSDESWLFGIV